MTTKLDKKQIKCAIFDLDGTLLNTIETINYYLNLALETNGFPSICKEDTLSFVGDGARKLISRTITRLGIDETAFDKLFYDYNRLYDADPYYLTEPYEGISELLSELKNQGIKLAVLSNKPDFAAKAAITYFFPESFDLVVGAKEETPLKPDPRSLLPLLSSLDVTENEIVYVGDSEPDVALSNNADLRFPIMVSWGFRTRERLLSCGAKNVIDKPGEIIDIIKKTELSS